MDGYESTCRIFGVIWVGVFWCGEYGGGFQGQALTFFVLQFVGT